MSSALSSFSRREAIKPQVLVITSYKDLIACNGSFTLPLQPVRKRHADGGSNESTQGSASSDSNKKEKKQRVGEGRGNKKKRKNLGSRKYCDGDAKSIVPAQRNGLRLGA